MYQITKEGLEDTEFRFLESTIIKVMKETKLLPSSARYIVSEDLQRILERNCSKDVLNAISDGILLGLLFGV